MRIALGVEYDGSQFSGWQMQKDGTRTVQECVENALSIVANEKVQIVCAGRTDTGVHATGQVVHFDCASYRPERAWVMGVNAHLPNDISSLWSVEVDDEFSARFSATARQYRYVILNRDSRSAVFKQKSNLQARGFKSRGNASGSSGTNRRTGFLFFSFCGLSG